MMADLRSAVPSSIGGAVVTVFNDYQSRTSKNMESGAIDTIQLPKSNVLEFVLGNRGSVIVRPSGTEPKLKAYLFARGENCETAEQKLDRMEASVRALCE